MSSPVTLDDYKGQGFTTPPLCPFCSKPWSESMIDIEAGASMSCSTCGPDSWYSIDITCDGCDRLIYRKEV